MQGPIGASIKRKNFELDPRLLQLQNELTEAENSRLPPEARETVPWDPDVPFEPSKRSRIMGELDQEVQASSGDTQAPDEMEAMDMSAGMDDGMDMGFGPGRRSFKTQLCKFYPLGTCQKGPACNFAHGEEELMSPGGGQLIAELSQEPKVMRSYKTQICKFFLAGQCGKGLACPYAHGEHELLARGKGAEKGAQAMGGMGGFGCKGGGGPMGGGFGPQSPMEQGQLPRNLKTQLCRFWPLGRCQKGEACTYAHGEEELLPPPSSRGGMKGCGKGRPAFGMQAAFAALADGSVDGPVDAAEAEMGLSPEGAPMGAQSFGGCSGGASRCPSGKYKTVPCKFWPSGQCQRGEACTFIHDEADAFFGAPSGGGCFGSKGGGCGKGSWDGGWGDGGGCWGKGCGKGCKGFAKGWGMDDSSGWGPCGDWGGWCGKGACSWKGGKGGDWGSGGCDWGKGGKGGCDWGKGGCGGGWGKGGQGWSQGPLPPGKVVPGFMARQSLADAMPESFAPEASD